MLRITCLLAVFAAALPVTAATSWDKKVEKAAEAVRVSSARAPAIALDTSIKAAELLRPTHPQLAWQFALSAAERLKAAEDSGQLTQRVVTVLLAINPGEGEKIARALPEQSTAYGALASYWTRREDPAGAAAIVKEAWGKGVYVSNASSVLSSFREKQPEQAAALFREFLDQLQPERATMEAVRVLLSATQSIASKDPAAAKAAFAKLLDAVSREKFNVESTQEMIGMYKLGDKIIETTGARDSLLLPIGIYVHALDAESYAKNEKLFETWRDDIAKLKPGDESEAASLTGYLLLTREALAVRKGRPAVTPATQGPPPKPAPFAEAWTRAMAEPEARRSSALISLLRRADLTQPQQLQTAREGLRIIPQLPAAARFYMADAAFRAASDMEMKPVLKPAAQALAAALAGLDKCEDQDCRDVRRFGRPLSSYDELAAAVRRSKIRVSDPAVAARASLIDLRDILEETYDFKLAGIHGGEYALRAQKGRVIILNFWATW